MVRFKKKEADRERMLSERATTSRNPKESTIYETNKSYFDQQHLPITPFGLPQNVTSADLEGYIKHRAQNPFSAATNMASENNTPSQTTTTDNELCLNDRIHKYWKDKYEKIRQQQQQELDHTIYSFNAKESKLLSKQIKTNEKLYQVQLEQDQQKQELEEAKLQLEQVRLQTEDSTSSSEEDERQRLGAYLKKSNCLSKAVNRHNSLPTLRETEITAVRHDKPGEKQLIHKTTSRLNIRTHSSNMKGLGRHTTTAKLTNITTENHSQHLSENTGPCQTRDQMITKNPFNFTGRATYPMKKNMAKTWTCLDILGVADERQGA